LLPVETQEFVEPIVEWAANQPEVKELWLVGSRVRGGYQPNSDLDVVLMTTMQKSSAYNFFYWGGAEKLASDLSYRIGVRVHMLQGDEGFQTDETAQALATTSVRIFPRLD
jgi:predicted nucleotidyltransferase